MTAPVCLITPPSVFLLDERTFVNLGILKVASALEARGYLVEHVDLDGVANFEEVVEVHARRTTATVFALTMTTPQAPATARIVAVLRRARPDAKLVVGGPHPTLVCAAVKKGSPRAVKALAQLREIFDVVVSGDGEDSVEQALASPAGSLIDADDPKGPLFLTRKRMEELPPPARHLVDMASYHYTIDGVPATSMICQLGCPFACGFCGGRASPMLRRARMRSTESVLAEMEHIYREYGFRAFMLYDDELNVNPKMVELMRGISALQKRLGVEFRLRGFVKSELTTREQCEAMYEAGFRVLLCGYESGSPRILENIQKKANLEQNTRCVELAKGAGLAVKALMSTGHPGESAETIEETKRWLLRVRPADFDCTVISTYCGSPYYDEAVETSPGIWTYTAKNGDRLHSVDVDYLTETNHYKGKPDGGYAAYVYTDYLASEDIVRLRDDLERDVRAQLAIPFNVGQAAIRYEHSMGQAGPLPPNILRSTGAL